MIKAGSFYIVWQIVYDLFLFPNGRLDEFLAVSAAVLTKGLLSIFGWEINSWGRLLVIEGYRGVEVLNGCNGLTLMALYSGFLVAFKGPAIKRIKFLLGGLALIYVLNVIRIMAFSLATVYFQPHWDTIHEFSPFIFFYPFILWLWYQWTLIGEKEMYLSPSRLSLV